MKNLVVSVDASEYGPRIYKESISLESAKEGIAWLIDHNGDAPAVAKVLLQALKSAVMAVEAR